MKVTFYWNFLNHHQVSVADAMYELLGEDFRFVATLMRDERELKGGVDYSTRPYCILAGESEEAHREAMRLAVESDVCVFGACSQEYAIKRAQVKPEKLAFECGERWLKRGWVNVLSPNLRAWWLNYMRYYRHANFYKLCSSAYTAVDDVRLFAYKGRHFKWGYFTCVDASGEFGNERFRELGNRGTRDLTSEARKNCVETSEDVSTTENKSATILWCARFLSWKHPELAVRLAERLKKVGYQFHLDFIGSGEQLKPTEMLAERLELRDCISFLDNMPNAEVLQQMRQHDIFLFTSDKNEGWGAVANEAMSNGCCLLGSDAIGSVPYLVTDGATGMIFKSCDLDSLYEKVKYLLDNPEERQRMARDGQIRLQKVWSPENAAKSLLQLIDDLQHGRQTSILQGPCSKA